jgi:sister-chromatid-cohesion protein PDS5
MIRLACVKSLLDLASTSGHALTFTNDRYLRISYSIRDPVLEVRKGVMHKLYSLLKTGRLGTRFLAILLLGVMDESPNNATNAKKYIMEVIPQMRREIAAANVENSPTLDSDGSYQIFPEYALPYLIYILAHHPDFSSMSPDYIQFQKVLFTYFDVVTKNVDNISFFNGLLAKIKTRRDVSNIESQNHLIVCDLAVIILPRCLQGSNNVGAIYPGKYYIPNFFRPETEGIAPITTPRRGAFDTSGVNETVNGSSTAMQHLRTLYLPKEFKLQERIARSIGVQQTSPSVATSKSKKSPGKATELRKRRPRKTTNPPSKKTAASKEVLPKRTPLPRNAKSNSKALSDIEYSSEEMEEISEEERAPSSKKKLVFSSDSEKEQHTSSSGEGENVDPEISVISRRHRRFK